MRSWPWSTVRRIEVASLEGRILHSCLLASAPLGLTTDNISRPRLLTGGRAAATKSLLIITGFSDISYVLEKIKPQSSKFHRIEDNLWEICQRLSIAKG